MNPVTSFVSKVIVRALLPSAWIRMKLRRFALVRKVMRLIWGGTKVLQYPNSEYRIYLDGYRNIGCLARNCEGCEPEEKRLISAILSMTPVSCAWDIGANIGMWSMFLSVLKPGIQVCCFEPDSMNLKYLTMTKNTNKMDAWKIYPFALSNTDGKAIFHFDPTTGATGSLEDKAEQQWSEKYFHAETTNGEIPISTIDSVISHGAPVPQFIKCDVEGHEHSVFQGGQKLLSEHHPIIFWEDSGNVKTKELLKSLGYRFYDLQGTEIDTPKWNTLGIHQSMTEIDGTTIQNALRNLKQTMPKD